MNRQEFITYLEGLGCVIVREDNKGYAVVRNVINSKMSGIPKGDNQFDATVCRICRTLNIEPPDACKIAQGIIEIAHRKHGNGE